MYSYNSWLPFSTPAAPQATAAPGPPQTTPQGAAHSDESIRADRDKVKDLDRKLNLARQRSTATLRNQAGTAPATHPQVPPPGTSARSNRDTSVRALEQALEELQAKYHGLAGWHKDAAKTASRCYGYWKDETSHHSRTFQEKVQMEAKLVDYRARILQLEERLRAPAASPESSSCDRCAHHERKVSSLQSELEKEKTVSTYWKEKRDRESASAQEKIKKLEKELLAAKARAAGPQPTGAQSTAEFAYAYAYTHRRM